MYDTAEYANSRLHDTIVRYRDRPVTVHGCREGSSRGTIMCDISYLSNSAQDRCELKELDLTPVPLGYANVGKNIAYLARVPKRSDYRQGLRVSNYMSLMGIEHRRVSNANLVRTIMGRYPSFSAAVDEVSNTPGYAKAFSRNFALKSAERKKKVSIMFKWIPYVGDVVKGKPLLLKEFEYLQESLEEAMRDG